jgi:predicted secreted protein
MAKTRRYTAQQVIDALHEAKGYVSKTASLLRCDPSTVYEYAKAYATVQKAWDAIREARHDSVESALAGRIAAGDTTAIIFYLKTQCKQRGYVERQEVDVRARDVSKLADDELKAIIEA